MSLYANYGPDDDADMPLSQVDRINANHTALQNQIEDEIHNDHFRFYGEFKTYKPSMIKYKEFDELDFSDVIDDAIQVDASKSIAPLLEDLYEYDQKAYQRFGIYNAPQFIRALFTGNDNIYNKLLDQIQTTFDHQQINISDYDDCFAFIYDLENEDDLHNLAEEYYEDNEY